MERLESEPGEVVAQLLDARLMSHRRVRVGRACPWVERILAARAVYVIQVFGLCVVRLEVAVADRPGRRDATMMANLAEIPVAKAEQRRAVEFRVSADVVVGVRVQ